MEPQTVRRFRSNPIEVLIFFVVGVVFLNSLYNLIYDQPGFHFAALSPMSANPISERRSPASLAPTNLTTLEVPCDPNSDQNTSSNKVRLIGKICTALTEHTVRTLFKSEITNTSNQFAATVFAGPEKFSTDYIPLSPGKNSIHMVFSYQDGTVSSRDVLIIKD